MRTAVILVFLRGPDCLLLGVCSRCLSLSLRAVGCLSGGEPAEDVETSEPTDESLSCESESAPRVCPRRLVGEFGAVGTL